MLQLLRKGEDQQNDFCCFQCNSLCAMDVPDMFQAWSLRKYCSRTPCRFHPFSKHQTSGLGRYSSSQEASAQTSTQTWLHGVCCFQLQKHAMPYPRLPVSLGLALAVPLHIRKDLAFVRLRAIGPIRISNTRSNFTGI